MMPKQFDKKFFEDIVHEKHLLLLTCFILYTDSLLVYFTANNILFLTPDLLVLQKVGWMGVFATSFGLLMTKFSRFCRNIVRDFGLWIIDKIASRGYYDNLEDQKRAREENENFIGINKLRAWAIKHGNSVAAQQVEDRLGDIENCYATKNYYFFLSIVIFINLFFSEGVLRYLAVAVLGGYAQWSLLFLLGLAIYLFAKSVTDVPNSMYYIRIDKDFKFVDAIPEPQSIDNKQQSQKALPEIITLDHNLPQKKTLRDLKMLRR